MDLEHHKKKKENTIVILWFQFKTLDLDSKDAIITNICLLNTVCVPSAFKHDLKISKRTEEKIKRKEGERERETTPLKNPWSKPCYLFIFEEHNAIKWRWFV